jgi:hypothetical protein
MTEYCCEQMEIWATNVCDLHAFRSDCPDCLIDPRENGSYGIIIHDGGMSSVDINFCPWCGTKLPGSEEA